MKKGLIVIIVIIAALLILLLYIYAFKPTPLCGTPFYVRNTATNQCEIKVGCSLPAGMQEDSACEEILRQQIEGNESGCAKAGEGDDAPSPESKIVTCCSGLVKINGCLGLRNGICEPMVGCGGICSDCGNNACEDWENKCNCPADCK